MIRIDVVYSNDKIKRITFKGHALYDDYGQDIVCAAVSATYLCTVNGIFSIDEDAIVVSSDNDKQIIEVLKDNEVVFKLLLNMIRCLKSLEVDYPKNINIR